MTYQPSRGVATAFRVFSVIAYVAFWVSAGWGIVFLADVRLVPTVDTAGTQSGATAVVVDLALLLVFAVHHSVTARASVKERMARFVPAPIERSLFVLLASACLALVFWQWQSLPATVWRVDAQPWVAVLWTIYLVSWLGVVASTLPTGHFEFFGLRQAGWFRPARTLVPSSLAVGTIYAWVRHPMMLFLLIAFWTTPPHDRGTPAVRTRGFRLHRCRDPLRGSRPPSPVRRGQPKLRLPGSRAAPSEASISARGELVRPVPNDGQAPPAFSDFASRRRSQPQE